MGSVTYAQNSEVSGDFSVFSANGKYMAAGQITVGPDGAGNCNVRVYETGRVREKPLWVYEYTLEGEADSILSDDGTTFASISLWYFEDKPLVEIYRNGSKTASLMGKDFEIDPARLEQPGSPVPWLARKKPRYRFIRTRQMPLAIEIVTIDGKRHRIDATTGVLVPG